ncbi:unnamed protein product, partial [Rotaria magnacalcarata]
NDEQIQTETNNNLKRISFAFDLIHSQTNTDHNYGERTTTTTAAAASAGSTWPNESSAADAQPPSSPTMQPGTAPTLY